MAGRQPDRVIERRARVIQVDQTAMGLSSYRQGRGVAAIYGQSLCTETKGRLVRAAGKIIFGNPAVHRGRRRKARALQAPLKQLRGSRGRPARASRFASSRKRTCSFRPEESPPGEQPQKMIARTKAAATRHPGRGKRDLTSSDFIRPPAVYFSRRGFLVRPKCIYGLLCFQIILVWCLYWRC